MLARMDDIPAELIGLRAMGTVSREDYERTVIPLLEEARCEGRRILLLFHFGPEFEGFTAAAVWEDLKVGWREVCQFRLIKPEERDRDENRTMRAAEEEGR